MKNILLISSGLSPQIITETLCFYSQQSQPIYFDEIHVITGITGKRLIMNNLLSGERYLDQLINDYQLENKIKFSEKNIHVLIDKDGKKIDDLLTVNQNKAAINQIFKLVDRLTEDENSRLIASIAGGRKTMSVIVGQAMQFYAREQDVLTHIVVDEKLLRNDFYYPTPYTKIVEINGEKIDYSKVKLNLDELPFIRLRSIIGPLTYSNNSSSLYDLVSEAESHISGLIERPTIKIDFVKRLVFINNYEIQMPPKNLAFYCALLKLHLEGYQKDQCPVGFMSAFDMTEGSLDSIFLNYYKKILGANSIYVERELEQTSLVEIEWIKQTRSKINKSFHDNVPPLIYNFCSISSTGPYGETSYGIDTKAKNINLKQR